MKRTEIPLFERKKDLFKFLKENKELLVRERKMFPKQADAISFVCPLFDKASNSFKAANEVSLMEKDVLTAKLAINATNLLDSHKDVHIPGLWKRTLKNNAKKLLLLEAHDMSFDGVISEGLDGDVKAYVEDISWKELGFDYKGTSEVLVFDATIRKAYNEKMFKLYAQGRVKNHSVGMGYVEYFMAINSEEKYYIEEKEVWEKYYSEIVNQDEADETGYFWAVTEAKAYEGSAVPRGSNCATPTLEIKEAPRNHATKDPDESENHSSIDYSYLINQLKSLN